MPNKSYTSIHIFSKQKGQMIWDFSFYQANLVFSGNETEKLKLQDLKEFMKIIEFEVNKSENKKLDTEENSLSEVQKLIR